MVIAENIDDVHDVEETDCDFYLMLQLSNG